MNVVFQMLINCPYKIGYTLWCNTWNLLKSYHLFETQYLMHMKTSHGIYTLLEGSNVMDMKNDFPSSVCFLIELKQTWESQITGDDLLILFHLAA